MKRVRATLTLATACLCLLLAAPAPGQEEPPPPPPIAIESAEMEFVKPIELDADGDVVILDRKVVVKGGIFYGTSLGPFVSFDGKEAPAVIVDSESQVTAYVPTDVFGLVKVRVTNPDGDFDEIDVDL